MGRRRSSVATSSNGRHGVVHAVVEKDSRARTREVGMGQGRSIDWHGGLQRDVSALQLPVPVRGRWISDGRYGDLRNTAWFVRNYRLVGHDDTLAVAKLCHAVRCLLEAGEPIESVVPSLVDLFTRP